MNLEQAVFFYASFPLHVSFILSRELLSFFKTNLKCHLKTFPGLLKRSSSFAFYGEQSILNNNIIFSGRKKKELFKGKQE